MRKTTQSVVMGLFFIGLLVFDTVSGEAWALAKLCRSDHQDKEIKVYFINGIHTSPAEARISLHHLFSLMETEIVTPPGTCLRFGINVNPSTFAVDALEAAIQRLQMSPQEFWLALHNVSKYVPLQARPLFILTLTGLLKSGLVDGIVDMDAIQKHAREYENQINEHCSNVVLVPHSQGNLYVNQAYESVKGKLRYPRALRIVAVATPAHIIPNEDPHITSSEDQVINWVRSIVPLTRIHNTTWGSVGLETYDWLGHSFEGYVKSGDSQRKIVQSLQHVLNELPTDRCTSECQDSTPFISGTMSVSSNVNGRTITKPNESVLGTSISKSLAEGGASATTSGQKGSLSASVQGRSGGEIWSSHAEIDVNYDETLLIEAPGKTGFGVVAFTPNIGKGADASCSGENASSSGGYSFGVGGSFYQQGNKICNFTYPERDIGTIDIPFTYGSAFTIRVRLNVGAGSIIPGGLPQSGSGSANIGVSYGLSNFVVKSPPPNVTVKFCRSQQ